MAAEITKEVVESKAAPGLTFKKPDTHFFLYDVLKDASQLAAVVKFLKTLLQEGLMEEGRALTEGFLIHLKE